MDAIKRIIIILLKSIKCFRKDRGAFGVLYALRKVINKNKYRQLSKYKNIYKGNRCFIVGTGPSLSINDINKLSGEICFGVNTLYKYYSDTNWRANYYCVIDPNTYKAISKDLLKHHNDTLFVAGNRVKVSDKRVNQFSLECSSFYKFEYPQLFDNVCNFSDDLSNEIYDGASVVYAVMQIAVYMGFKEIILIGVDCNYDKGMRLHNNKLEYDKNYKYNWTKQTGLTMIEGFKVAKKYADEHGIKIYNATRGGMLEVFERVNLDDWVG